MNTPTQALSNLLILGAGGHGRVVADAALRQAAWAHVSATDRNPQRCIGELLPGVTLKAAAALDTPAPVHIAIGDGQARQAEAARLGPDRLTSVIHPMASVSPHASIGAGCFIAAQAVIGPNAELGQGVIVNHGAVVDHDASVGDFAHIAPRAALGGGVRVGAGVLIGAGSAVLPGLSICTGVVVGAGAVVHQTLTEPGVYVGVPARRVK